LKLTSGNRKIVSFRVMYLSKASRWWSIWTGMNISWESDVSQIFQIFLKAEYLR
jgi:hypothetical protein